MKNLSVSFVLASILLSFLFSCEAKEPVGHEYITFKNLSDSDIHVIERWQRKISPTDTFYICGSVFKRTLAPGDSSSSHSTNDVWEMDLKDLPFVQYFVFSESYPIDNCHKDSIQIFTERYQLKRYLLTKEDLDDLNWVITYP